MTMRYIKIVSARFAAMAALAVAALPLCASIPRGYMGSGIPQHSGTGNLTNRTDGAGRDTRYAHDALNRLVSRSVSSVDRFSYDAVGNLLSASNAVAREAFTYDVMNRVETANTIVNGTAFSTAWKRDLGGLVTNILYATGKAVTRTYDTDGRLATVSDWLGHTWAFTRDAAGRLTALSCPNGVTGAWTYDANHAVASWSWSVGGSPFAGRVITRDAAGVKTKEQVTAGLFPNPQNPRRAFNTFDAADRLVSAQVVQDTNTYAETYLYDLNGALTNKQSAIGNERYEYDCAGRLSYLQLLNPNSSLLLAYDALGNRIVCGDRIWITDHADSLKRPLMECDLSGNVLRYYIWAPGRLLGFIDAASGVLTVAHCDEYGSVIALTDEAGNALHEACYSPYGENWGSAGANPTPFAWLGGYGVQKLSGSDCQLYVTRHRLYSATLCRFLSADPLGLGGGPNFYAYCLGNPLAYIDPLGLGAEGIFYSVDRLYDPLFGELPYGFYPYFMSENPWLQPVADFANIGSAVINTAGNILYQLHPDSPLQQVIHQDQTSEMLIFLSPLAAVPEVSVALSSTPSWLGDLRIAGRPVRTLIDTHQIPGMRSAGEITHLNIPWNGGTIHVPLNPIHWFH